MYLRNTVHAAALFLATAFAVILFLPEVGHAHLAPPELQASIRDALLTDPRTAGMSEEQLSMMVHVLADAAAEEGLTPEEILWRPADPAALDAQVDEGTSCGLPGVWCVFSSAYGLDGTNDLLPLSLGAASMLMILLIAMHREHHRTLAASAPVV